MYSRRTKIKIISYLTVTVVVLAVWGTVNFITLNKVKREVLADKERALTSLGAYLDEISTDLLKCSYASSSPMMAQLSEKVWKNTGCAKVSLSEIANGESELSGFYKFLSQAGEYTQALSNKLKNKEEITKEEYDNLTKLKGFAENYRKKLNYLIEERQSGGLDFEKVKSTLDSVRETKNLVFADELKNTSEISKEYPTLIYDGPYSDSIESKKSAVTEKLKVISKDKAQSKAAEFLGVDKSEIYFFGECENNLPCYMFYNADYTVSVTKKGGLVNYMLSESYAGEAKLSVTEAVKKAEIFLSQKGYKSLKESYYSVNDGICTVNFAYLQDDIICYTDLIKVSVTLDTGKIVSFDSTGYIMNHKERAVKNKYNYTVKSAEKLLNKSLTVISGKKAFIPTEYETENFVYEYRCKAPDNTELLIYTDPDTGEEKDVLILLYSDNGVLTK